MQRIRGVKASFAFVTLALALLVPLATGQGTPGIPESTFPVVAAVGDIACVPGRAPTRNTCRHAEVADLVEEAGVQGVLILGDAQYERGTVEEYLGSFDLSWGRFKEIIYPSPGNHDYYTRGATGYFAYFGDRAGSPDRSWYSFGLGGWRLYSLDSNCELVGCGPGSEQYEWLSRELQQDDSRCSLAFFHHPRFASGPHGGYEPMAPIWELLAASNVDLALAGHDHIYERFAPMDGKGQRVQAGGLRQFVVGTGGSRHYPVARRHQAREAAHSGAFGVLLLTLAPDSFSWRFEAASGSSFTDEGAASCH